MQFNLSGLKNVYSEALNSEDKTMAFDLAIGRGRFLFLMLLSDEDKDSKDNLFIYLRTINRMIKLKLYGSHRNGVFTAYFKPEDENHIIEELQLGNNPNNPFDFERFLNQLNSIIPEHIPLNTKIDTLRDNREQLRNIQSTDESEKTVFDGVMQLEKGVKSPRERTLRKLYIYTETDPAVVSEFIRVLKKKNMTVKWTTPDRARGISIETFL